MVGCFYNDLLYSTTMNLKVMACTVIMSTIAMGCSSEQDKDAHSQTDTGVGTEQGLREQNEMETGEGQGSGTGSLSGTNTGTPGTGNPAVSSDPGKSVGSGDKMVSPATDAESKIPDTSVAGKWPARGNP